MRSTSTATLTAVAIAVLMITLHLPPTVSEATGTLQPGFSEAIVALRNAQSAGATPSELSEPVALLNKALELNREALKMSTSDQATQRADLLTEVDGMLTTTEIQAAHLTVVSSHRRSMNEFLTILSGAIAAILGTIVYASAVSLHRRFRIKRTFKMRVSRK